MAHNSMKRCDDPNELIGAIEHFEKQPQNRRTKRVLTKLRAKFDKLVPPTDDEKVDEPGAAQADEP